MKSDIGTVIIIGIIIYAVYCVGYGNGKGDCAALWDCSEGTCQMRATK